MTQLTVPTLETLGNTYIVRWEEGVEMRLERIYEHRNYDIDAEITIRDETELAPHLLGPQRTAITKTWRNVVADLERVSERLDWRQRLTQATMLVLEHYRHGAPVLALGSLEEPEPVGEVLSGVLWQSVPSLLYGPGGVGKSILALNFMAATHTGHNIAGLVARQSNCLVLDWETSEQQVWWRNKEILAARGLEAGDWPDPDAPRSDRTGMVFYRFMAGPLAGDVEFLKSEVHRLNIGTICIDSAGPACGGEPESATATLKFFEALRSLGTPDKPLTSLILGHVSHAARRGGHNTPFGSVYWTNIPRNTFELQAASRTNAEHTEFALHHRKSNIVPLREAVGFRLSWDEGCNLASLDIRQNAQLMRGMPYPEQAATAIEQNGPLTAEELADIMDTTPKLVATSMSADARFVTVNGKWDFVNW